MREIRAMETNLCRCTSCRSPSWSLCASSCRLKERRSSCQPPSSQPEPCQLAPCRRWLESVAQCQRLNALWSCKCVKWVDCTFCAPNPTFTDIYRKSQERRYPGVFSESMSRRLTALAHNETKTTCKHSVSSITGRLSSHFAN